MGVVLQGDELEARLGTLRQEGRRVILTNGCFDLLHFGHLSYLEQAKALGDVLLVGVNTDDSVTRLKGPGRPLVGEMERARLLAALDPVDIATIFSEPRADTLLRRVMPAVYVKGGDYQPETLPEAATAAEVGAEVRLIPYLPGHSTTALLRRIREGPGA